MASVDLYIRSMERFSAKGVVLKSGSNVMLRFDSGDRFATQSVSHAQLMQLVGEISGPSDRVAVAGGTPVTIDHTADGKSYTVQVTPSGSEWTVSVQPGSAKAPPPSTGSGLMIERTSYADQEAEQNKTAPAPAAPAKSKPTPRPMPAGVEKLIDKMLVKAQDLGASDLHLCCGSHALVRLHGEIVPLEGFPDQLTPELLEDEIRYIMPEENEAEFAETNDTDFAYAIPGVSRFRVNVFRDRKGPGAVMRGIPFEILSAQTLGLPDSVLNLCKLSKGLVLVTGPTGSGKSTTLAAMIDHINSTRNAHIITIEDPIEFVHDNKKCLINQREVRTHTGSFKQALRAALREDPDIVLVGEMRDLETIAIAVETAETGHLVFGTLHTTTAPSTVDRIIDQFPTDEQEQVRTMLAESLQGVIAQVLCKKIGGGRAAALEILLGSPAVSNLIREKKTFQLFSIMQTGRNVGMVTMNDSLMKLVKAGKVAPLEAYIKSVNKAEMKNLLKREGHEI